MHYDYEAITAALRDVRLPKAAWTHQAHVAAGLWFVWHHGIDAARILVPAATWRRWTTGGFPFGYYSEARLRSAAARAKWVEPDLISDPAAARRPGRADSPPPEPSTGD